MFNNILTHYGLKPGDYNIQPVGSGLINHTWTISNGAKAPCYILQQINTAVFRHPEDIALNIRNIGTWLKKQYPDYLFAGALPTVSGNELYIDDKKQYFRLFPFIPQSHSVEVLYTPEQAFEAARQFALFTRLLSGFDTKLLKITIPQFHDLPLRYRQFSEALAKGNVQRIQACGQLITWLQLQQNIVQVYESVKNDPAFPVRVIHHDTKISNVLFDDAGKGLCVIDLDTVMPGYFFSDVGDMMRTYLSPANEEEKDFDKIQVRDEFFEAIASGYIGELKNELTETEKAHFVYAGQFMMYMQALRFITDYLNNDVYYGARYEDHNLVRAQNQVVLLQKYMAKSDLFHQIISTI
jgi:Ser/Thr protein kinase RdoA (MazF antagonist)